MKLRLEERKMQTKLNIQFGAVADIYMAKKEDGILKACNVNQ